METPRGCIPSNVSTEESLSKWSNSEVVEPVFIMVLVSPPSNEDFPLVVEAQVSVSTVVVETIVVSVGP